MARPEEVGPAGWPTYSPSEPDPEVVEFSSITITGMVAVFQGRVPGAMLFRGECPGESEGRVPKEIWREEGLFLFLGQPRGQFEATILLGRSGGSAQEPPSAPKPSDRKYTGWPWPKLHSPPIPPTLKEGD